MAKGIQVEVTTVNAAVVDAGRSIGQIQQRVEEHLAMRPAPSRCSVHGCIAEGKYMLNGEWACGARCLELLLRVAIAAEQKMAAAAATLRPLQRVPLGRLLVQQGSITEGQLERALRSQQATGAGKLGCWLKQQVDLTEAEFSAARAKQERCPVFGIGDFQPASLLRYLPMLLGEHSNVVPLRIAGSPYRLVLGFEDAIDHVLVSALARMHGIEVEAGLMTATEFWAATREFLTVRAPQPAVCEASTLEDVLQCIVAAMVESGDEQGRLVATSGYYWLRTWTAREPGVRQGAQPGAKDFLCRPCAEEAQL